MHKLWDAYSVRACGYNGYGERTDAACTCGIELYGERAGHLPRAVEAVMKMREMGAGEDGGAVLEVALVMPVFLLMVMGAMQFGIVLFGYCAASFAARNAVRYASVHSSASLNPATVTTVQQAITPWLWMGSAVGTPVVAVSWPSGNSVGYPVQVTLTQTYNVVLPFTPRKQLTMNCVASRIVVR
jgi:Flp pilus assembly protein TadG